MQKYPTLICAAVMLYITAGCNDELNSFLSDHYQNSTIPSYKIAENLDGKLLVTFTQSSQPGTNGAPARVINSVVIDNISNDSLKNLDLIIQVYPSDSLHIQRNVALNKRLVVDEDIPVNGRVEIFLDSTYTAIPRKEDLGMSIIAWNDDNVFAQGIYAGHYRAYKEGTFKTGLSNMIVAYTGETRIELDRAEIIFITGLVSPLDSLLTANALRHDQTIETAMTGSLEDIQADNLITTLLPEDNDVYDSIQLIFKKSQP